MAKTEKQTTEEVSTESVQQTEEEKKVAPKKNESKLHWYIVKSNAGKEKSIGELIKQRIRANDMEDVITEVVVPTQEKIVIKRGKKQTIEERIFPGYILIQMVVNDETLHLIRNTEGVLGFIGASTNSKKPSHLSEKEAKGILEFTKVKQQPAFTTKFAVNDPVKVINGPFKEFIGTIQEINESKGQLTVLLSIFGRETPVQLDFLQVTKL